MRTRKHGAKSQITLQDEMWGYYSWLMRGTQRGKVLSVLEFPMTTGAIKKELRNHFQGNGITGRSVARIIGDLVKERLVKQVKLDPRNGYGRVYKVTKKGQEMQELMKQNGFRGIL